MFEKIMNFIYYLNCLKVVFVKAALNKTFES